MAAVKALQLTHTFPKQKGLRVWDLRFSFAVNPSLFAHLPPHCFHVCCLTREVGWRDMERKREMQQEKREKRGEKMQQIGGKVPHHTVCPADTTNSPACVCGEEGLLKKTAP